MPAFKSPSFQDRAALAATARQKAIEQLKAKAPVDPALVARRLQAEEERAQAQAERQAAKLEAEKAAKAARAEKAAIKAAELAAAEAAAALKAARLKPPTAAEMKAARDARYAARKAQK